MLLKELQILNCRKIKQATIQFLGPGLQVISGPNKAGKSTIAQAIQLTMEGPRAFNPGIITLGESQGEILAVTDDGLKIRTQISSDKVKQTVSKFDETAGRYTAVSGGVREYLNSIRSGLELPWSMRELTDAKIVEILKERTGTSQRIAEIDAALKDKETARRDVGRDKTKMGAITPVKKAEYPPSIDDIQEERKKVQEYLEWHYRQFKNASEHLRGNCIFSSLDDIDKFKKDVEVTSDALMQAIAARQSSLGRASPYTEDDLVKLEKRIAEWVEEEKAAEAYKEYLNKAGELEDLTARYDALTAEIEGLREDRKKTLSDMRLGVKGLEIGEDNQLYHNGIVRGITDSNKISNWSTAESVQVFFQIAVRFSGEMKVLIVDNAESLDEETTEAISNWAQKAEYLVILLKVASVPEALEDGIIYIKEGEVSTK